MDFMEYLNSQLQDNHCLSDKLRYILLNEGHQFRPKLIFAWSKIAGANPEDAFALAAAIECIHALSLLQDDLPCMDNATMRRGKPCLHLIAGEADTILTSDYLFGLSNMLILNSTLTNQQKIKALNILNKTILEMSVGQSEDLNIKNPNLNQYLSIHNKKTGALLSAACELGTIFVDDNTINQQSKEFGSAFGLLYQILDDIKDNDGICTILNSNEINKLVQSQINILNKYKNNVELKSIIERIIK